jgi:hypothetical protein
MPTLIGPVSFVGSAGAAAAAGAADAAAELPVAGALPAGPLHAPAAISVTIIDTVRVFIEFSIKRLSANTQRSGMSSRPPGHLPANVSDLSRSCDGGVSSPKGRLLPRAAGRKFRGRNMWLSSTAANVSRLCLNRVALSHGLDHPSPATKHRFSTLIATRNECFAPALQNVLPRNICNTPH